MMKVYGVSKPRSRLAEQHEQIDIIEEAATAHSTVLHRPHTSKLVTPRDEKT